MNAAQLIAWLETNAQKIQFGEIKICLTIHDGQIRQVEKTVSEKERANG